MRDLQTYMVSSDDVEYAYAVGRIRAIETTLLGRQRLERLSEARTLEDALRHLSDTTYGMHLDEIEEGSYLKLLKDEETRLLDLVDLLSLDRDVSDILHLKYDFQNLKVAVREKVAERDLAHLYVSFGLYGPEAIAAPLKADTIEQLPEPLIAAARAALETYSKSGDPSEVDLAIDRAMFARFVSLVEGPGNLYIEGIVRTWIDLANIRSFMRARYLGFEARALQRLLFDEGFVSAVDFAAAYALPLEELLQHFELSPYRQVIEKGGAGLEKDESFVSLEREIANYMVALLRQSRYFTFGLEIIIAYALLKQNEIRTLSLILAAKDRKLPLEAIKERIPDAD
ncbi:MAG: V-type ATPase subunit [Candidatus Eisenbacteria bacterium]